MLAASKPICLMKLISVIGVTETRIRNANSIDFNPEIPGYTIEYVPKPLSSLSRLYTDGTQLYLSFKPTPTEQASSRAKIESCASEVNS